MKNAAEAYLDPAKDVQNTAKAPRNKQETGRTVHCIQNWWV